MSLNGLSSRESFGSTKKSITSRNIRPPASAKNLFPAKPFLISVATIGLKPCSSQSKALTSFTVRHFPPKPGYVARLFRPWWYIERASERITIRAQYFAAALGVTFNRVLISDLKVRWGSCTPNGTLNFNWRIMKAPTFVIDYLAVHELAHLMENNHTARFWNIISVQVPRWGEAKEWLREHGDLLEVDF